MPDRRRSREKREPASAGRMVNSAPRRRPAGKALTHLHHLRDRSVNFPLGIRGQDSPPKKPTEPGWRKYSTISHSPANRSKDQSSPRPRPIPSRRVRLCGRKISDHVKIDGRLARPPGSAGRVTRANQTRSVPLKYHQGMGFDRFAKPIRKYLVLVRIVGAQHGKEAGVEGRERANRRYSP